MRKIVVRLDHLPPTELNPNKLRSLHWSERSRVTQIARQEVGWLAKAEWGDQPEMVKARISYEFFIKDKRKHDADNLLSSCKPYTDGLIDAGVLTYDDIKHLEYGMVRAMYADKDETVITIEEL